MTRKAYGKDPKEGDRYLDTEANDTLTIKRVLTDSEDEDWPAWIPDDRDYAVLFDYDSSDAVWVGNWAGTYMDCLTREEGWE